MLAVVVVSFLAGTGTGERAKISTNAAGSFVQEKLEDGAGSDGETRRRRHLLVSSDLDPDEQIAQKAVEFNVMMGVFSSCANHSIPTYTRKAGWGDPVLTRWYGVELDSAEFVIGLNLAGSHLKCEIPTTLGDLIFLESLVLSSNELTGTIPSELGVLTNLHTLNLMKQQRKLVGSIPDEIGSLTNLRYLDLSYNSLTMPIPESLGQLRRLEVLELSNNFINGTFPSSLANLERLEVLNMKHNEITSDVAHLYELLPQFELDTANTQFWMSNIFNAGGEQSAIFQKNDV